MFAAAFWGFAEATFFFIVPDVLLTHIALKHGAKKACIASLYTVSGAVIGGMLMYYWAARSEPSALAFLERIPAIGEEMLATVKDQQQEHGIWSLFLGSANGIPYKIYAVQAPAQGISFTTFALMSFPARLYRLLIASLLAAGIGHLTRHWSNRLRYSIFAAFWIVSYAIYFYNFIG